MKQVMKQVAISIVVILFLSFTLLYYLKHPLRSEIWVGDNRFVIELAATPREKEQGLSYRKSLKPDHGMLFLYDHKEQYGFWMNQMKFPLDFIWIDGKKIADLTQNVPIYDTLGKWTVLQPQVVVDKVLEVNAGTIARLGIKIGDELKFK